MLYGSFLHKNIQNQVCKRTEMDQGESRVMEDRVISSAEGQNDGGQEQQGVIEQHQNQNCHNSLFFPGVDGDGSRQGFEGPRQREDEHREGEEEEDGEKENWIDEIRCQADKKDCDERKGPGNNTDHERDMDGSSEAVPQWLGDGQIPVTQDRYIYIFISAYSCYSICMNTVGFRYCTFPEQHRP